MLVSRKRATALTVVLLIAGASAAFSQARSYPDEIRGYKVERTVVEIKRPRGPAKDRGASDQPNTHTDVDELIQFGQPRVVRVTPLGITLEVPIVVAPITQKGRAEFLVFEDMVVNGTNVKIDEYHRAFDLPNKESLTLRDPLSFYVYLPSAVVAAVDDWSNTKETWPVTGRVYVFGKFKKGWFSGKRCVPVELNLKLRNPLRDR